MYCVIQKIINKKANPFGAYKELTVDTFSYSVNGKLPNVKYTHNFTKYLNTRVIEKMERQRRGNRLFVRWITTG
ncbi:hypothetical protein PBAT_11205 [Paenibacillus antarcticus]|uniref:Uncharacterized protein n=1 Tax=Paenibacillus antarcticus TaxID=253703 RepID=A0A168PAR5_9BACL|nr:hypothetical protein PBAT_11205 [Paenibacillus antarcticus]